MLALRKKKNQRLERRQVLDVKLRSSETRRARARLATMATLICLSTFFGLYLFWRGGEWVLNHFLYENKAFAIHEIEVQTDGVIALEQLRRWSGVKLEDNLLALDQARVKRDLELIPAIKSVSVERDLPNSLRLRVTEREPIVQVHFPQVQGNGYQFTFCSLDEEGYVILPLSPRQRSVQVKTNEQLPLITGILSSDLRPGRKVESAQVRAALNLIAAFEHSPMAGRVDLQRIDVSAQDILQVTTAQGNAVVFRLSDLDSQLRRWREAYDLGFRNNRQIATLDLSVANNVPIRWMEAGTFVSATPKAPKPLRYKKKNV